MRPSVRHSLIQLMPPWLAMLRLTALSLAVVLVLSALLTTEMWAADSSHQAESAVNELFTATTPPAPKELDRLAATLAEPERTIFMTVALELFQEPAARVAWLSPAINGRREVVAAFPYLACSLADALALAGTTAPAQAALALLPDGPVNDLNHADTDSARASVALALQHADEARGLIQAARDVLGRSAPQAAYETWRHRLIRRRLDRSANTLEAGAALELGGPAYWAWLQADRSRSSAGYQAVVSGFPGTLFATAAALELARQQLAAGATNECLRVMDAPQWRQGPLAVPAMLLRGDALLQSGRRWAEAKGAYEAALALLRRPLDADVSVNAAVRAAITPAQPLHRMDGSFYPVWEARPNGIILIPSLDPGTAAYLRYQTVVRLATVTYATGDQPAAIALARTLMMFDDVDREMELRNQGAGGAIICNVFETGKAVVPLDALRAAPADLQAGVILGIGFYEIYDWAQARAWLAATLPRIPASQVQARDATAIMQAMAEKMLRHYPEVLALTRTVKLKLGAVPTRAWFLARSIESDIYAQPPENFPAGMAAL